MIVAIIGALFWDAWSSRSVIVDPFDVPASIAAQGISGKVVASELLDRLKAFQDATRTNQLKRAVADAWSNKIELQIPEAGISIDEVENLLHRWLANDQHITGSVVEEGKGIALTIRGDRFAARSFTGSRAQLHALTIKAAEYVYGGSEPYLFGVYLEEQGRALEVIALVQSAFSTASHTDKPLLLSVWSNALADLGRYREALDKAREGVRLDPRFWLGYDNMMGDDQSLGEEEAIVETGRDMERRARRGSWFAADVPLGYWQNLDYSVADWPATVPNGVSDIATFGSSNLTGLFDSANTEVDSVIFDTGGSAYTISPNIGTALTISGAGVVNDSGVNQTFVTAADSSFNHSYINFTNSSSAGSMVTYLDKAAPRTADSFGGVTSFLDTSNAGSATFVTEGGTVPNAQVIGGSVAFWSTASAANATFITGGGTVPRANGGEIAFLENATAANATFTNNPGLGGNAQGGFVEFLGNSTAGDAIITNNGATGSGALGGATTFTQPSRAGNATLIANGGSPGGGGGQIVFGYGTFGDTARIELFGNGFLDLSNLGPTNPISIGSLEGNGIVQMGGGALTVGTRNQSTVFAGTIVDSSFGGGALVKTGNGILHPVRANTYAGRTNIMKGTLQVGNHQGSATGTGAVTVRGGRLAGSGTIAGSVTVGGINSGRVASSLAPGRIPAQPQTLTIQSGLTFQFSATYSCDLNSASVQADQVVANSVTIAGDAQIALADSAAATLQPGTTFIILDNTSANPITGTFANLPDGAILTVSGNNFQASYEGGDGNDLTLTVVP